MSLLLLLDDDEDSAVPNIEGFRRRGVGLRRGGAAGVGIVRASTRGVGIKKAGAAIAAVAVLAIALGMLVGA